MRKKVRTADPTYCAHRPLIPGPRMPNYRRAYVPGGTFFFTLKTEHNAPIFSDPEHVKRLGAILRDARAHWPYTTHAIVVLPDHLHAIWSLPSGDTNYSTRWAWIKKEFTRQFLSADGEEQPTSLSRQKNRRRGVWQRRFWEHTIESEADFDAHFDYIHWNPVKHGYVECPGQWQYSSFHRWVSEGAYSHNWGCGSKPPDNRIFPSDTGE